MTALGLTQDVHMDLDGDLERLIDSLLAVLTKEIVVYDELQTIIHDERETLKKPSLELISDSNSKKETCILKARMLEEVRANIIRKLARHLGQEESDITITLLAEHASDRHKAALKAKQTILLSLIGAIKETNQINRNILDYSLSYVRNSINFLNQIMCTGADYAKTGKLKTGNRNGAMFCKEG